MTSEVDAVFPAASRAVRVIVIRSLLPGAAKVPNVPDQVLPCRDMLIGLPGNPLPYVACTETTPTLSVATTDSPDVVTVPPHGLVNIHVSVTAADERFGFVVSAGCVVVVVVAMVGGGVLGGVVGGEVGCGGAVGVVGGVVGAPGPVVVAGGGIVTTGAVVETPGAVVGDVVELDVEELVDDSGTEVVDVDASVDVVVLLSDTTVSDSAACSSHGITGRSSSRSLPSAELGSHKVRVTLSGSRNADQSPA